MCRAETQDRAAGVPDGLAVIIPIAIHSGIQQKRQKDSPPPIWDRRRLASKNPIVIKIPTLGSA